ncbi:hypothetical protein LGH82_22755 [Mesorhizobium sp. PAMC28654]|uniref:sunset domain-containing protein n=1 Tax=Mesorhizobium sp. PAMC28654 TaxID=2880934 RepID=UPI001D0A6B9E|nr:hypothetical protein [Mesorhizobium sp. PAMC28654]UDL92881.1 hypothetical protein LGH82_22755 [Mesorhizobium sp. PAMC28654]
MKATIPAALLIAAAGAGYFADDLLRGASAATSTIIAKSNCNIKGNISIETGEHIYHVPGQEYYAQTIIRPEFGERWFCSEAEAREAGWRRSKV